MHAINSFWLAAGLAFNAVNAHMIMNTPKPYGSPNNSPLDASGSDFPCKGLSSAGGEVTKMAIGSPQILSFTGSAVHGGGSCQISLTSDKSATKSSKWQVIHSIEGGCPANTDGNLPTNSNGHSSSNFTYSVPQGIAPGGYTLAWTWFNHEGNREMYMNCATIEVTGGASKRDVHHPYHCNDTSHEHEHDHDSGHNTYANETLDTPSLYDRAAAPAFPEMFVANIPTSACLTQDSKDLQFPNPGSSVQKAGSSPLAAPTGPQCNAGPAAAGGGSGTTSSQTSGGGGGGAGAGAGAGSGSGSGSGAGAGAGAGNSGMYNAGASSSSGPGSGGAASGTSANNGMYNPSGSPGSGSGSGSGAGAGSGTQQSSSPSAAAASGSAPSGSSTAGASYGNTSSGSGSGTAGGAAGSSPSSPSSSSPSSPSAGDSTSGGSTSGGSASGGSASGGATSGISGSSSPSSGGSSSGGSSSSTCTQAGQSICSPDGRQIGTCTSGMTVTWIPVAAGTKCSGGLMVMAAASQKEKRGEEKKIKSVLGRRSAKFLKDFVFE